MILKQKYDRDGFLEFLQEQFLPDFKKDIRLVNTSCLQATHNVFLLGQSDQLDLQIFELTHTASSDARVSLAADGFRIMKDTATYRALAVYRSGKGGDWRLSLLTATPEINERGRITQSFSNPRRYSFFLGPEAKTHTPEEYLINKGRVKDFEDLKKRFSIEVVNKDFYTQIATLFTQLAGGRRIVGRKSIDFGKGLLNLPGTNDDTLDKEFTVRLIGRLVFCWFLKKKRSHKNVSLLPEEILSAKAVTENKGYYHSILEPLFFEVLNTPTADRAKKYQSLPWAQIPFLNGGLFTFHAHDFYEPGALGISKHINTLQVPDSWLKELFEIFETYNFTIDENTSVDIELAIEPEMLGRIFENLLAEINPETGETARKATGSYYTPRPIVEYMVDESLKQYLLTKTKLSEEKITALLTYDGAESSLTEAERNSVVDALDVIKIIDPACGSGAFPMGILQKMLLILQKVDPKSSVWLDKQISKIENVDLRKRTRERLKSENVNYIHKLGIIQSAIYGVDIQPIAVEISKLRFFLSLIVDEKVNDEKTNRGVEPLPNLEFKFVCANSLIGLPSVLVKVKHKEGMGKVASQKTMFDAVSEINELKNLRDEYLRSFGVEKEKIEKKFSETQSRMFQHSLNWGAKDSQTLKLSQWNPFGEEACPWFDPDWMFDIKDGFDIVIANPPWVSLMGKHCLEINKNNIDLFKRLFPGNTYMPNLYEYFVERGISFLKESGHLTFIIPDRFGYNESCAYLRRKILEENTLREIIYRWEFEEVIADTMTLIVQKKKNESYQVKIKHRPEFDFLAADRKSLLEDENCTFRSYENLPTKRLVDKVKSCSRRLITFAKSTSGFGGKSDSITEERINKNQIPILKGASILPYRIGVKFYFEFKDKNITGRTRDVEKLGAKDKILMRKTGDRLIAARDSDGIFPEQSAYFIYDIREDVLPPKYLLALLNSKLMTWYYRNHLITTDLSPFKGYRFEPIL